MIPVPCSLPNPSGCTVELETIDFFSCFFSGQVFEKRETWALNSFGIEEGTSPFVGSHGVTRFFGGSCKNDGCLLVDFGGEPFFCFCGGAQVQVRYDILFFLDVSCLKVIFWCKEDPENISDPWVFKPNGPSYMDKFGGSLHGTRTWLVGCVNDC